MQFKKIIPLYEIIKSEYLSLKILIPNFAGGSLPRCDRGDREYYCATMLMLFKPWRHGKNLKDDDQSWDEAFQITNSLHAKLN